MKTTRDLCLHSAVEREPRGPLLMHSIYAHPLLFITEILWVSLSLSHLHTEKPSTLLPKSSGTQKRGCLAFRTVCILQSQMQGWRVCKILDFSASTLLSQPGMALKTTRRDCFKWAFRPLKNLAVCPHLGIQIGILLGKRTKAKRRWPSNELSGRCEIWVFICIIYIIYIRDALEQNILLFS